MMLMMCKFLKMVKAKLPIKSKKAKVNAFNGSKTNTGNIQKHYNIRITQTLNVIRSTMVPSFCILELPQPSHCSIKILQVFSWNVFFIIAYYIACIINYVGFLQIGSHVLQKFHKYKLWGHSRKYYCDFPTNSTSCRNLQ